MSHQSFKAKMNDRRGTGKAFCDLELSVFSFRELEKYMYAHDFHLFELVLTTIVVK